jgi:hypothetical protein
MFSLSLGFVAAFPTTSLCGQARSQPLQGLPHRSSLGYCLTAGGSLYSVSCASVSKLFSKVAQLSKPSKCGPKICRTPDLERNSAVSSPPAMYHRKNGQPFCALELFASYPRAKRHKISLVGKNVALPNLPERRKIEVTTCLQIEDRRPSRLQVSFLFRISLTFSTCSGLSTGCESL